MSVRKITTAINEFNGFKGPQTISHVTSTIPTELQQKITGKQIVQIMNIRNAAYHEGVAAALKGIEMHIGLPNGISLWDVIGGKSYLGYKEFTDGLEITDILEARGQQVKKWKDEDSEE